MNHRLLAFQRWLARNREFEAPFDELITRPPPSPDTTFNDAGIVSLDIETTGLDPTSADMLSVGWVVIEGGRIDLASAETHIVRPSGEVGSSASVHGLTDTVVMAGQDWSVVLDRILRALCGRALLVHHAGLDKSLLDRMCQCRFGAPLLLPVIDTLALERRRRRRRHQEADARSLRLNALRAAYKLPRYSAHDCLVDAIATAELLIAMVAHNDGADSTQLKDLYS